MFVQKPYLRTKNLESNLEKDIDLGNQIRMKNLRDSIGIREACSQSYVGNLFNDTSILKNTTHIDLNDRNFTNPRFIQVNELPQLDSHLTAKLYVDNAVDESSLVRNNQDIDFKNHNLTNKISFTLNKQAETDNELRTRAYVDQFHQKIEQSRRDLLKNNQDNDFNVKNLKNIDSITVNKNPSADNDFFIKKYLNDDLDKNTILRFNQTLEDYRKVSA